MADSRTRLSASALQLTNDQLPAQAAGADSVKEAGSEAEGGRYVAISPSGNRIPVPKELFVALTDFMKTRKCAGSITIQFRTGEIVCVEAVAKKTYRNS